jgi:hypothetical protein
VDDFMKRVWCLTIAAGLLAAHGCSVDSSMGDFVLPLTGGYHLVRTSESEVTVMNLAYTSGPEVPAKVVEIAWNNNFILAKQQELAVRGKSPDDMPEVPVPGKFDYWIIDITHTNEYGPFQEREFRLKVLELGQTNLVLKDVYKIPQKR